jgi:hypothetical protein
MKPLDPVAAALALAVKRAIERRDAERAERRAKMTVVEGKGRAA